MRKDAQTGLTLLASLMIVFPVYAADSTTPTQPQTPAVSTPMPLDHNGVPVPDNKYASRDYQQENPAQEQDEDQGQEINEDELQTIQGDQEQFDDERAALKPLDQNNALRQRVATDEAKLSTDMQAKNSTAIQDDQITLKADSQDLHDHEARENDQSQELSEYRQPDDAKVLADNSSSVEPMANNGKSPAEQEKENLQQFQTQPADAPTRQPW
jgi:hypothetical protein